VPAATAVPAQELTPRHVRRLTRQSTAHRAVTTWQTRLADAWSTAASVAIGLALLGGWLASVRDEITLRTPASGTAVPASVTALAGAAVALAVLLTLLDRLGPISASPAAAAWWLPLPADRRGLLRGDLARLAGLSAMSVALVATPLTMALTRRPSVGTVTATAVGAAVGTAGLVAAVTLLQTSGRRGVLAPVAGAIAVVLSAAAVAVSTVPALAERASRLTTAGLPTVTWLAVLAVGLVAVLLLVAADRSLGRLDAGSLRALGAASAYASASVFSMDTRDLGRALATGPRRPRRHHRRFRLVRRPWQAVTAADLVLLARSPWQSGQLVVAVAVPVLAARTEGLGRLPAATATGLLLGGLAAAVAVGHPARHAQAAPALDRLLPLSPAQVVAARCLAPASVLTVVLGIGGVLIGLGTGAVLAWAALLLATVPGWTAAALRGAYRPELDWSGPVVSTPMGVLPAGIVATVVQGVDVGLVGSLPAVWAVLRGGPPSAALVGVQLVWGALLAAGALVLLARRRPASAD
jgi:hypothetical protein